MHDTYLVLSPGMFFLAIALILLPFWWLYRALLSQYGIRLHTFQNPKLLLNLIKKGHSSLIKKNQND
jgi:hypothetical protein